jgi:hypothetical protein
VRIILNLSVLRASEHHPSPDWTALDKHDVTPAGRRRDCAPMLRRSPKVAQGGLTHPPWRWSESSGTGFDSQSVVHGNVVLNPGV